MEQKPKYPILLVHGLGMRDDASLLKYWGGIPGFLEEKGVQVYLSGQDAFGSVSSNAKQIKQRITQVLHESGAEKVNIIAHSKGGLDCREALMDEGCATHVASLITLSTPHHGSKVLERLQEKYPEGVLKIGAKAISFCYRLLGDESPDVEEACYSLLPDVCEERNRKQTALDGIFVRSYAASFKAKHLGIPYFGSGRLVGALEGENDGVVSEQSAKWLGFSGTLRSSEKSGVSHVALNGRKGLNYPSKLEGQEINCIADFYALLLKLLRENGC